MTLFQRLFGGSRQSVTPEAVRVFLTRAAKWHALCACVRNSIDAGERTLIVAHFPATLREAESCLNSAGILTSIRDRPLPSLELSDSTAREASVVMLVPVPALVVSEAVTTADNSGGTPLSMLIPEMHPLRAAEDSVDEFAAAIPGRVRLATFVSLEDPLMERTCGPWVRDLLRKLGMQEQEEIQSRMISRRIQSAQARLSRLIGSFEPADSVEEWMRRNLPPDQ